MLIDAAKSGRLDEVDRLLVVIALLDGKPRAWTALEP